MGPVLVHLIQKVCILENFSFFGNLRSLQWSLAKIKCTFQWIMVNIFTCNPMFTTLSLIKSSLIPPKLPELCSKFYEVFVKHLITSFYIYSVELVLLQFNQMELHGRFCLKCQSYFRIYNLTFKRSQFYVVLNPFQASDPFLYPVNTLENLWVFCNFQMV